MAFPLEICSLSQTKHSLVAMDGLIRGIIIIHIYIGRFLRNVIEVMLSRLGYVVKYEACFLLRQRSLKRNKSVVYC